MIEHYIMTSCMLLEQFSTGILGELGCQSAGKRQPETVLQQ
jgi:hypothetical protein